MHSRLTWPAPGDSSPSQSPAEDSAQQLLLVALQAQQVLVRRLAQQAVLLLLQLQERPLVCCLLRPARLLVLACTRHRCFSATAVTKQVASDARVLWRPVFCFCRLPWALAAG